MECTNLGEATHDSISLVSRIPTLPQTHGGKSLPGVGDGLGHGI